MQYSLTLVQEAGASTPPKRFDLVKIRAKSVGNLGKMCEYLRNIDVRALILQKYHSKYKYKRFFWRSCFCLVLFGQVRENLGKFGENLGKNDA